jgi:pyruvate dehydrogenase (quinone)
MLATMAPGMSFAIAAQLAYPGRQSLAIVGDGGFAMLMAELSTALTRNLAVNIILLKNNAFAEVMFEQREIGFQNYGCELSPIDFVAFARACGADGFHCERPEEVRPALRAVLSSPRAALVEAVVDAEEKPTKPDDLTV